MNTNPLFLKKQKIFLSALLFVIGFSIPFSFALNSVAIGLFFLFSFLWFSNKKYATFIKKPNYALLLFLLLYLIQVAGVFYSYNQKIAFSEVSKSIVFLLLPIAFINISSALEYKKIRLAMYGLILGVFLLLISAHISIINKIISEDLPFTSLITHFTRVEFVKEAIIEIHPPYFGLLIVFIFAPLTETRFLKAKMLNKIIIYCLILYLIFSLYQISSLMSLVMLLVFLFIYIIHIVTKKQWKTLLTLTILMITILLALKKTVFEKKVNEFGGGSLVNRIDWMFFKGKGDTSRPHNWKSVVAVAKNNLIFGVGTDGGINQLQKQRNSNTESFIEKHNAHNQYLEVLLRHGIAGVFIYTALLVVLVKKALLSKDRSFKWFLLVFIISSTSESYLQRQIGITFFAFFATLFGTFYKFDNANSMKKYEKSTNT